MAIETHSSTKPRNSKRWIVIAIGLLVILGIGSCVWTFAGMFQDSAERNQPTLDFIENVSTQGFPDMPDPIYTNEDIFTQEQIDRINTYTQTLGVFESVDTPACNVQAYARTNGPSGYFATCTANVTFDTVTANARVTWRREEDIWKVYGYNLTPNASPAITEE